MRESITDSLLATQLFIAISAITSLILAAVTAERTGAARALASTEAAQRALADEQAALRRVATTVAGEAPPSRVFEQVTEEVGRLLGLPGASVMHYDGARTATVVGAWSEDGEPRFPVGASLDLDSDTVVAKVLRSGTAQRMDRYEETSGTLAETLRSFGYRAAVAAPVTVGGRLWGVLAAATTSTACPRVSSGGYATSPTSSRRLWPMPTPTRSWPHRGRGSSRSATPNACGSSGTCTTALSSGSSPSPLS